MRALPGGTRPMRPCRTCPLTPGCVTKLLEALATVTATVTDNLLRYSNYRKALVTSCASGNKMSLSLSLSLWWNFTQSKLYTWSILQTQWHIVMEMLCPTVFTMPWFCSWFRFVSVSSWCMDETAHSSRSLGVSVRKIPTGHGSAACQVRTGHGSTLTEGGFAFDWEF